MSAPSTTWMRAPVNAVLPDAGEVERGYGIVTLGPLASTSVMSAMAPLVIPVRRLDVRRSSTGLVRFLDRLRSRPPVIIHAPAVRGT